MSELIAATRELMRVAAQAKKRLSGTNIMGQKLDKPLADELSQALERALKAADEAEQQAMKDEQRRNGIRDLAREVRSA